MIIINTFNSHHSCPFTSIHHDSITSSKVRLHVPLPFFQLQSSSKNELDRSRQVKSCIIQQLLISSTKLKIYIHSSISTICQLSLLAHLLGMKNKIAVLRHADLAHRASLDCGRDASGAKKVGAGTQRAIMKEATATMPIGTLLIQYFLKIARLHPLELHNSQPGSTY
jgi:hypothetical protein